MAGAAAHLVQVPRTTKKHGRHRGGSKRRIAGQTSRASQRKAGRRK